MPYICCLCKWPLTAAYTNVNICCYSAFGFLNKAARGNTTVGLCQLRTTVLYAKEKGLWGRNALQSVTLLILLVFALDQFAQ